MLPSAKQLTVSFHAELYKLIPEDHQLRKIHEAIDFTFIHELVRSSYCEYYGRPANEPELLFRLLFLQVLYNLSDDRIIEEAQVNLAYKWFLGLNPEDKLPDPSQLSRFRNHRLRAGAVDEVLKSVVRQSIEKGLVKSKSIIMDSTHTLAASQNQKPLEVLRDAAKRLFRVVVKKHSKLEKKLPWLPELKKDQNGAEKIKIAKTIVEDERLLANKGIMSAIDPDARFGWKSSTKSFSATKNILP